MRLHLRAVRLLPLLLPILLLPMGEAFGQGQCPRPPDVVSGFPSPGSQILEMAAVGSELLLAVEDSGNGFGIWAFNGQSVRQLLPKAGSPSWPARVSKFGNFSILGDQVFFLVEDEINSYLWVTDPARTSFSLVTAEPFFDYLHLTGEFTVLGNWLYFRGRQGFDPAKLWRSNGTLLEPVKDLGGNDVIEPSGLESLGNRLFFAAKNAADDVELWVFEEARGRARQFQDLRGDGSSSPASLTAVGSKLYFTATAAASENMSLWKLEENAATAEIVAGPGTLGDSHQELKELTAVGDKLFFHMDESQRGDELWVTKGTAATTQALEIQESTPSSAPHQLTAVGRMLFFIANNGTSGNEPWRSDGTVGGTTMVDEFLADSGDSSETPELKAGPGVLLLSIFGTNSGKELWSVSDTAILQLTDFGNGTVSSTPHAMTILGDRLYFAANPAGQGDGLYWLPLNQVDCNKPSVTCPGPLHIEAVSPAGAYVFLPPPVQMSDDSFTPLSVSYSPGALARFDVDNSTPAIITVRDMAGNAETCSVTVNVRDTRPPELVCPADLTVEATDPGGANVSYPVEAWDPVSGVLSVSANPPPGARFPLGQETRVTITAQDRRGNTTTPPCEFKVTVKDTQPPKLTCPRDIVEVAMSDEPIHVDYAPLQLEDATGATLGEDPQHPSGSPFELGSTEVRLTAKDPGDHVSECTFWVHVVDPVAPTLTCPGPQQAVATGPEGAVVDFPEASAEDALGAPSLRYSADSGSTFPVGETTVTATATDRGGNEASCSFTVTVTGPGQEVPTGCACRAGSASAGVYWLLLALAPLWARRRIGRLAR